MDQWLDLYIPITPQNHPFFLCGFIFSIIMDGRKLSIESIVHLVAFISLFQRGRRRQIPGTKTLKSEP